MSKTSVLGSFRGRQPGQRPHFDPHQIALMLVGSLLGLSMPASHVMGAGGVFRGEIAKSSGAFLFVWTLHTLGVTTMFSLDREHSKDRNPGTG